MSHVCTLLTVGVAMEVPDRIPVELLHVLTAAGRKRGQESSEYETVSSTTIIITPSVSGHNASF